jgi:hypothetical protein
LWSQDEAGAADKTGEHTAMVRLNILGALKADDAEDFAEVFGKPGLWREGLRNTRAK